MSKYTCVLIYIYIHLFAFDNTHTFSNFHQIITTSIKIKTKTICKYISYCNHKQLRKFVELQSNSYLFVQIYSYEIIYIYIYINVFYFFLVFVCTHEDIYKCLHDNPS